jgi:hypothetical protein
VPDEECFIPIQSVDAAPLNGCYLPNNQYLSAYYSFVDTCLYPNQLYFPHYNKHGISPYEASVPIYIASNNKASPYGMLDGHNVPTSYPCYYPTPILTMISPLSTTSMSESLPVCAPQATCSTTSSHLTDDVTTTKTE